ncbi:MAG: DUF1214 domain-containing protein [Desulfobacterales bacterium]
MRDADDGITLYLQHESPGKDKEPNWLPAPEGHSQWYCVCIGPKLKHWTAPGNCRR